MNTLRKMWAIVALTFKETLARKTFIAFFGLATLLHVFFIFAMNVDMVDGALSMVKVMGQDVKGDQIDVEKVIIGIESVIAMIVFTGGIFLSIFASASLIPNMLEKGHIEILISKPLSRSLLFLARYAGALFIMAVNVSYLIGGTWLILSVKTGIWNLPYLYSIPMVMIAFAIMYALMALVGVTTRSPGVSVMVAYTVLFFSPLLVQKDEIYAFLSNNVYYYLLEGIYHLLPKTFELGEINQALVMSKPIESWGALLTSTLAGAVMLSAATYIFVKKDF
jgi:ABC-type transport system involved in multi-copper enzyme maturation permease subunit